jgi:hypothetical protein
VPDGTHNDAAAANGEPAGGASPVFVKGFLPGLLVGLVVGLTLGAVVSPLLDARARRIPEKGVVDSPSSSPRERDRAFEGTGLPLEEGVESDEEAAEGAGEGTAPAPED